MQRVAEAACRAEDSRQRKDFPMATTLADIKVLLEGLGRRFFANDARDMLVLPYRCTGKTMNVILDLQHEGRFLQFTIRDFDAVPKDGASSVALLEEMLALNFEMKFIKLGRDPSDGEVVGYGDLWIEDGGIAPFQLDRMLGNFVSSMVEAQGRLELAAATGMSERDRKIDDFFNSCIDDNEAGLADETDPDNKQTEEA
jgi:hypothetical protein